VSRVMSPVTPKPSPGRLRRQRRDSKLLVGPLDRNGSWSRRRPWSRSSATRRKQAAISTAFAASSRARRLVREQQRRAATARDRQALPLPIEPRHRLARQLGETDGGRSASVAVAASLSARGRPRAAERQLDVLEALRNGTRPASCPTTPNRVLRSPARDSAIEARNHLSQRPPRPRTAWLRSPAIQVESVLLPEPAGR
jgi:hypothetical protein